MDIMTRDTIPRDTMPRDTMPGDTINTDNQTRNSIDRDSSNIPNQCNISLSTDDGCEFNELASPTLTSVHPDSAYDGSPGMKWGALANNPSIPNIEEEKECNDDWRFKIFPQDLLISPNMNNIYKPFIVSASLDQTSPHLFQQQSADLNINIGHLNQHQHQTQQEQYQYQTSPQEDQKVAAPWQVWDQADQDITSPTSATFSMFSPSLHFSVFDHDHYPLDQTNESRNHLSISTAKAHQQNQHHQQQGLQSSATIDSTSNATESIYSYHSRKFSNDHAQSPLEFDETKNMFLHPSRPRQNSSIMSPLTLQLSQTLSSMKGSALPHYDSSSGYHSMKPKPSSTSTPTVSKKNRQEKEGKETKCFPCNICCSTFIRNHDLKRHIRIHLGIRPYKCDTCPKSFTRMDALNRHRNIRGCKGTRESD